MDQDLWMRPGIISDRTLYWQLVLLYNDNILDILVDPELFLHKELGASFTLEEKSIGPRTQYFGKNPLK